ncbi:MAG: dihydrodipicolinate synthase family protein [Symbiobacteriaceae bacterium]|jgi:4-hydroxy-tetrahydrodipicolinate synthase|nr:dihydrodipicolinate synthase family protein [Symbiobacteriaceae bacterium]
MSLRSDWTPYLKGGLFPAVPVPLTTDGRTHLEAQERYVRHMATQPVAGVAVWAHTGRGLLLAPEQRNQLMRSWRAGMVTGRHIIAGVGARPAPGQTRRQIFDAAVRMGEEALENGADMLMAYAPSYLRGAPDQDEAIVEYHRRLAALGAPLILFYLYEEAGGVSYSPAVLTELFKLPEVVGVKMATLDSVMTFQDVAAQIRQAGDPSLLLITGEDRFLGYSLMCGAEAALIGMGAACTTLQADLLRAHATGDAGAFLDLNRRVDRFAQITFTRPMEGYIQRMLWALVAEGVIPAEATFDPWGPAITQTEIDRIMQVTREVSAR